MEQTSTSSKGGNGAIIGGIIGGILLALGLYGLYYYFIRVPKYQFVKDYPVVLTNAELGLRKVGEAIDLNTKYFKKGDIVTGTKNPDGTITVSLEKIGYPKVKKNIPIQDNLVVVNKWF